MDFELHSHPNYKRKKSPTRHLWDKYLLQEWNWWNTVYIYIEHRLRKVIERKLVKKQNQWNLILHPFNKFRVSYLLNTSRAKIHTHTCYDFE